MISRNVWNTIVEQTGGAEILSRAWELRRISKIFDYYGRKNFLMEICQFYSKKSKYIYGRNHYADIYEHAKLDLINEYNHRLKFYADGESLSYLKEECSVLAKQMIIGYALCTIPYLTAYEINGWLVSAAYPKTLKFIKKEVLTELSANLVAKLLDESKNTRKNIR